MNELQVLKEMDGDMEFLRKNFEEIKKDHADEFIAIKSGKIVASEKSLNSLMDDLKKNNEDPADVMVHFISSVPFIF